MSLHEARRSLHNWFHNVIGTYNKFTWRSRLGAALITGFKALGAIDALAGTGEDKFKAKKNPAEAGFIKWGGVTSFC